MRLTAPGTAASRGLATGILGLFVETGAAAQETVHVPFVVSSPLFQGGRREGDSATSQADLLPSLLGRKLGVYAEIVQPPHRDCRGKGQGRLTIGGPNMAAERAASSSACRKGVSDVS